MDRCLLCGQDTGNHHETCPDASGFAPTVFVDADEVARGWAALSPEPTAFAPSDPAPDPDPELDAESAVERDAQPEASAPDSAGAVPWSIPIRDRATPAPAPRVSGDVEQRRLLALVVGGVALLVVSIVGALLIGDDSGSSGTTQVAGSEVTRDLDPTTTAPEVATSPSTTTTTTSSTTTAPTTTVAPTTTTAAPAAVDTGDVPILTPGQIGRGWVAQMSSVPRSAGGSALQTAYDTIAKDSPSAVAITSDDWPALRSGYWVIVVPDFDSGADAVGGCDAAGRSGDGCFARYLSANADQNARSCARADDGSLSGDCGA